MREKNSSRSITAGKEVRSTVLTVYFSHRGTEDTEKRKKILREPCVSVREKNSSRSMETGNDISRIPSGFNIGRNANIQNVRTPPVFGNIERSGVLERIPMVKHTADLRRRLAQ
ncbi:MAG: hypothetical protein ACRCUY_02660 [Thermoguttaceae bacterium]